MTPLERIIQTMQRANTVMFIAMAVLLLPAFLIIPGILIRIMDVLAK